MHKIDSPHSTSSNEFTDGNPTLGIEATELIAKWFNTVQRELVALVQFAGLTLSDIDDDQITEAITALLSAHANLTAPHNATADATAERLVVRDSAGRASFAPGTTGGEAVVFSQFEYDFSDVAGWVKFPGGFVVQWGVYVSGQNSTITYSWPVAFPNGFLAAVGQIRNQAATHESTITVNNITSTQFGLNGYAYAYSCFVIGVGW